jgi:hypothetical protein
MARETKVVAAGKVKQGTPAQTHFIQADKLERIRLGHGRIVG